LAYVLLLCLLQGLFNSMQIAGMNSLAYADTTPANASMASTWASTLQQMSMGLGLALGAQLVAHHTAAAPQIDATGIFVALRTTFIILGLTTILSSPSF
jgi:hypothetical protein